MYSSCLLDSLNLKLNHHGFENQGLSFEGHVLSQSTVSSFFMEAIYIWDFLNMQHWIGTNNKGKLFIIVNSFSWLYAKLKWLKLKLKQLQIQNYM